MGFLSHTVAGSDQAGNWIEIYRSSFDPVALVMVWCLRYALRIRPIL